MSERTEVSFDAALMMALRADAQKELDELPTPAQLKERYPDTSRWDARLQAALHKRRPMLKRPVDCRDVRPGLRLWRAWLALCRAIAYLPATPFRPGYASGADGTWLHGAAWRALKEEILFFVGSLTCLSIFLAWRLAAPWCAPFLAVCVTALLQVLAAMGDVYHEVRLAVAVLSFLSLLPVCASLFAA